MGRMNLCLGLAQIDTKLGDVAHNLGLHLDVARDAVGQGIDLLVFPELSLTGYDLREGAADVAIRATADDPTFARMLVASRSLDIVFSFVERDSRHRLHIAAAYLSAGEIVHLHRKVYLPTYGLFDEARYFGHGQTARAFDTRFGRLGMLICEDLWHPSLAYLLWQDGADVLLLMSASVEHGLGDRPETTTASSVEAIQRAYAILFTTFVVHVNRAGEEPVGRYWGGSTVFGPQGDLLARGPLFEPALAPVAINLDDLREARLRLPLLRDERPDLTLRELQRIVARRE
jgi:predicted amidohydrolase